MRELFQTLIGARLLLRSLLLETEVTLSGGGSHDGTPQPHADSDRVSVWRLGCHRQWMLRLPDAFEHQIEQWQFGSKGVKPTTLRGPPEIVARVLCEGKDPLLVRPQSPLRGKSHYGTFKTAAAKEYPSSLCRSLVLAALTSIRHRLETHGFVASSPLTTHEQDWIDRLHANSCTSALSGTYLPDFQG